MQLTKTDFIQSLNCPRSLWLLLNAPDEYPHGEFSVFLQRLTREGYEVEHYVRQFFENAQGRVAEFQRVFETEDGLFARADALEGGDGGTVLYEIKSSTSVKTDAAHNHLKGACFQVICAERSGQQIDAVSLVHLNGEYVRAGARARTNISPFSTRCTSFMRTGRSIITNIWSARHGFLIVCLSN